VMLMDEVQTSLRTLCVSTYVEQGVGLYMYQMREITRQILKFIDYAETELNMMHCDIKDDNIGLHLDPETGEYDYKHIKILDFGNSFKLSKSNMKGQAFNFKAPETFFGIPDAKTGGLTPKSDVWSLGIMLMQLCSSRQLFKIKPQKNEFSDGKQFMPGEKEFLKT
jgi:serine/threonine protein kinase